MPLVSTFLRESFQIDNFNEQEFVVAIQDQTYKFANKNTPSSLLAKRYLMDGLMDLFVPGFSEDEFLAATADELVGGRFKLLDWDLETYESFGEVRIVYGKDGEKATLSWTSENNKRYYCSFVLHPNLGWIGDRRKEDKNYVHPPGMDLPFIKSQTISPPATADFVFVNNKGVLCISSSTREAHRAILVVESSVLEMAPGRVVVDVKFYRDIPNTKGPQCGHYLYTASIFGKDVRITTDHIDDEWWGKDYVNKRPPLFAYPTPYNPSMHHFLDAPEYSGEHLWVVKPGLMFGKGFSGEWIPIMSQGYINNPITDYIGVLFGEEVEQEYTIYKQIK